MTLSQRKQPVQPEATPNQPLRFRHYIADKSPNSVRAVANLKALCAQYLDDHCTIETIDVYEQPEAALDDEVYVCPTLLKLAPLPQLKIIGDLSDTPKILDSLGLRKY